MERALGKGAFITGPGGDITSVEQSEDTKR
jgi:hypothetical protein